MRPCHRHLLPELLVLYKDEKRLLTAMKIGEMLGVSQTYVSRIVKENMGRAEYRYLTHLRRSRCKQGELHPLYRGENVVPALYRNKIEARLGVELTTTVVVHHIDENRANDDFDNLAVLTRIAHTILHRHMAGKAVEQRYRKSKVYSVNPEAWAFFNDRVTPLRPEYLVYAINGYAEDLRRDNLVAVTAQGLINLRRTLPWT